MHTNFAEKAIRVAVAAMPQWTTRAILVAMACLGAAFLGLALAPADGTASVLFWPAAGVSLAACLRWGNGQWPAVLAGLAGAFWLNGAPWWLALGLASGGTAAPWAAARWLRRAGFDPQLEQRRDLWLLLSVAAVGATVVSSANNVLWLTLAGHLNALQLPTAALQGWLGEVLGMVCAGVPLITVTRRSLAKALEPAHRVRTVGLLTLSLLAVAAALLAPTGLGAARLALLLAPMVLLSWLAMRSGLATASAAVLILAVALQAGTAAELGPFVTPMPGDGLTLLWAHVAALNALVLLTHAQVGELARLEERWQLALEGSDLGVADWNLRTGQHYSSPRWQALMGDPSGEQTSTLERWLNQVHGEDRGALRSALAAVDTPAGAGLRREARLRLGDTWHWFDTHVIVAERDDQGRPLRVVASLADIGARRSAEDRQQLSSNVFQHLHEGLVVTDADLRILDVNPTYCRIVGHSRESLLGTVPGLLQPNPIEALNRQQQAALWQALRSQGHWVGEVLERRRGGEASALHVTVSTVRDPEGALRYHVLVVSDVTEQRQQKERLERQAHFDELTRLPNRARLAQLMAEAMAATDRDGYLLAVCYLDLDRFKAINEAHGQVAGNQLLAEVANRLRSALRTRGNSWTDSAARLGGDEFVLLLRAGTVEEARAAVERVLRVVSEPIVVRPGELPEVVTASVGATVYPLDASDADTLLRHADHAMYGVKQSGRNGYLFFDPENSRLHQERMLALGRVQEALDRDELVLYYQPKVDMRRGVVLGMEALLRWNHPEKGLLPPAQFLPLIEHTGLSAGVGDHVLTRALEQLTVWHQQGLDLSVSVNISARHLQEPDFAQRLAELLARHAKPLGPYLELEVLETAALNDIGLTSDLLERCGRLGVRWALDDFGTGYSTLTYLKRLPVQVLKIDRSFIQHMLVDTQDRAIVEGVISLARTFDCTAVAEGVETPAQARLLLDMGCEVGQGVGIAAPMPAAEVAPWVREWRGLFALSSTNAGGHDAPPATPGALRQLHKD